MSIEAFFDHTCDIYHLSKEQASPGFKLPASPSFAYPEEPSEAAIPCHFAVKSASVTTTQEDPANMMDARIKLTLPVGTDIRINDKIVWRDTGLEYTAELPRNVRNHHKFVFVKRTQHQRPM